MQACEALISSRKPRSDPGPRCNRLRFFFLFGAIKKKKAIKSQPHDGTGGGGKVEAREECCECRHVLTCRGFRSRIFRIARMTSRVTVTIIVPMSAASLTPPQMRHPVIDFAITILQRGFFFFFFYRDMPRRPRELYA